MSGDRILLVEDDKEIREGVEIFLKSQGYVAFQAADGYRGCDDAQDGWDHNDRKAQGKT